MTVTIVRRARGAEDARMERPTFLERFLEALDAKGWDANDFSYAARIPARTISRWMNEGVEPQLSTARRVAVALGVSLDWLAGLKETGGPRRTARASEDGQAR
jgi:transcriptional regulator with XRE-family HTH domain